MNVLKKLTNNPRCLSCRLETAVFVWQILYPDGGTSTFVTCAACAHSVGMQLEHLARTANRDA